MLFQQIALQLILQCLKLKVATMLLRPHVFGWNSRQDTAWHLKAGNGEDVVVATSNKQLQNLWNVKIMSNYYWAFLQPGIPINVTSRVKGPRFQRSNQYQVTIKRNLQLHKLTHAKTYVNF